MSAVSPREWRERGPDPFPPPWASAWGDDPCGLWADMEVGKDSSAVLQRLRWIEPGQFLMGSPNSEEERFENEGPQHQVTITKGLWLADTACTQALWQAVMGENPSRFHAKNKGGPEHPVEQVNWNMIQEFLPKLQALLPGCHATLPTEAEWEYACRAGTTTPFSFGDNITPEQVNYDGNHPYAKGKKGKYRERSVPVKDLPANTWGLYQMHGNLWEWCADGLRDYRLEPAVDPGLAEALEPLAGDKEAPRALRGGNWVGDARGARSASRVDRPGRRDGGAGFRFALRSTSPAGTPEALRPEGAALRRDGAVLVAGRSR